MDFPTAQIVGLIFQLLPGFIALWIFYGLTAHPPKTPFERVVQALIFTGIVKALVFPIRFICLQVGKAFNDPPPWSSDGEYCLSVLFAVLIGFIFTSCANTNWFHARLPEWISKRTSYPTEWFSTFNQLKRYVYLHLKDGRRMYGWPSEFPDSPSTGHFVLMHPEWIADDNTQAPLLTVDRMLVPASEVVMVEFEKVQAELDTIDQVKHLEAVKAMVAVQKLKATESESDIDKPLKRLEDESIKKPRTKRVVKRKPKNVKTSGQEGGRRE